MLKESVLIDDAINLLNEALKKDPEAIANLIESVVPCNKDLASRNTIQVRLKDGKYFVGMLGILNGIFGTDERGWGPIAAVIDGDIILEFKRSNSVE